MTARTLYGKHCDALWATQRAKYNREAQRYERSYPVLKPVAWPFLPAHEQDTWKDLAIRLTPKRRKP